MIRTLLFILSLLLCYCNQENPKKTQIGQVENTLDFYRGYSKYTDPGEYSYLFRNLPDSLQDLCNLIKCQLIHPVDLEPFKELIPENRYYEDRKFPSVKKLLEGLLELDSNGLTFERKPQNRLVVTCRYHSILLASILKSRGIPVRLRYGFAPYLAPGTGLHIGHVICEVWNEREKHWMYVDPDRKMVDFPREEFETGNEAWIDFRNGEIKDPNKYGVLDTWGEIMILGTIYQDLLSVMGYEALYWEYPVNQYLSNKISTVNPERLKVLDEIALLMNNPGTNLNKLIDIYKKYKFLHHSTQVH
jgi:hypothetical protein